MNVAQYLNLPLSYCNYVKTTRLMNFDNELLLKCLQRETPYNPPQFIINYLIDKAMRYERMEKMYHIYTIVIFHLLSKPIYQKELLKHTQFLNAVLKQLEIMHKSNVNDDLNVYVKKTFVIHKLILKRNLRRRLYYLLYVRSVFVNLYFKCLHKRYAFGNSGYIESKKNYENTVLTL